MASFALASASSAWAFTANITPANPRAIYLQVGVGGFTGTYSGGGTPGNNATVNLVSVTVPASAVGTGAARAMTTNSTVGASSFDGFVFCNTPAQLYIGGFYRYNSNTAGTAATLTATAPANLVSAAATRFRSLRSPGPAAAIATAAHNLFPPARLPARCKQSAPLRATSGQKVATPSPTQIVLSVQPGLTPDALPTP